MDTHSPTQSPQPEAGVPPRTLVVKVTCGVDQPERANQALNTAATACAMGIEVSLWLAGEASWFAVPGRAADLVLPHAAPAQELIEAVLATGTVTLCTQCAVRRSLTGQDVLPGVRIAGSATFTEEILAPGAQALVY